MHTPIPYRIIKGLIRASVSIYFRKVEISGKSNVPLSGPVLLAANHPQSGTDAFILGLAAGRMVSYLAHSGLFTNRWKGAILRSCGVIPVYRAHEITDAGDKNVAMFESCYQVLEAQGAIGIFPEGTSAEERRVQKLKTGAARIALHVESRNDFALGLKIVPVGINFQSRRRFRSRVLVSFGLPIDVSGCRAAFDEDQLEAVHELTSRIEKGIHDRVVNISRTEFTDFVSDIERVYKEELLVRQDIEVSGSSPFKRSQTIAQEIPRALDFLLDHRPEVVWRIRVHLTDYLSRLESFKVNDDQIRREPPGVLGAATRFAVLGLLGLPITIWGVLWNYIPYRLTGVIAARMKSNLTQTHMNQMIVGLPVYLIYYGILLVLMYNLLGFVNWIVFSALLLPTGLFAKWHSQRISRRRQALRLAFLRVTHGIQLKQLQRLRREVIAEMDLALEMYVKERGRGVG